MAVALCREALRYRDSPENQAALASALARSEGGPAAEREALTHARRAMDAAPNDPDILGVVAGVALEANDADMLNTASARLLSLAPEDPSSHVIRGVYFASTGSIDAGLGEITRAHALGLPDAEYKDLSKRIEGTRPLPAHIFAVAWKVLAGWLAGMALLLLSAWALSRATVRAATELASNP